MAVPKSRSKKKYYTAREANATLPLVRAIVRDITDLARDLQDRHERLSRVTPPGRQTIGEPWAEELRHMREDFERDRQRMQTFEEELRNLGVELKDFKIGLIDFPCLMNNREVCLCWKLDEPEVAFWHEVEAGFAGRQRLPANGADGKPEARLMTSDN